MEKKPINIEVGQRIRAVRERNFWSREYLAEATGFSVRYLGMVEVGTAGVSLEGLRIFSKKLSVSTDFLLNGSEDVFFKDITCKLAELQVLSAEHIENIEAIIDAYIRGTKK